MVSLKEYLSLIALFLCSVQSARVCDFTDTNCLTQAARNNFRRMLSGIPGLLDPLEPLHEDMIIGEMPTLKFTLRNCTLSGLKNCEIKLLSLNTEKEKFEYVWECPRLILDGDYVSKGSIENINLDHEGSFGATVDDYTIKFLGKYGKMMNDKDTKLRIFVDKYEIETEPKGKITLEEHTLNKGDIEMAKSFVSYINKNELYLEKLLRKHIFDKLLSKFVEQMNFYLKAYPVDEILAELN